MRSLFFVMVLILSGCASAQQGGFLDSYTSLTAGKYLERVSVSPELPGFKNTPVEVAAPQLLEVTPNQALPGTEAQNDLKNFLEVNLRNTSGFQVAGAAQPDVLKLETAITKLSPGSRAMRWFASELGAGHSLVQVEGRLVESASGKIENE